MLHATGGERGTPLPSDSPLSLARKGPQKRAGGPVGCRSSVMQRPCQWQIFQLAISSVWNPQCAAAVMSPQASCQGRTFLSGFEPGRAGPAQTFHHVCGRCAILCASLAFAWQGRPCTESTSLMSARQGRPFPNLPPRSWNTTLLSGLEPGRAGPAQTFHHDCGRCAILGASLAFAWQGRPFSNLAPRALA